MANIRIKDQTTDTALVAGDYVIVDNETEGTRKFDLGQKLVDIDDDITDVRADLNITNEGIKEYLYYQKPYDRQLFDVDSMCPNPALMLSVKSSKQITSSTASRMYVVEANGNAGDLFSVNILTSDSRMGRIYVYGSNNEPVQGGSVLQSGSSSASDRRAAITLSQNSKYIILELTLSLQTVVTQDEYTEIANSIMEYAVLRKGSYDTTYYQYETYPVYVIPTDTEGITDIVELLAVAKQQGASNYGKLLSVAADGSVTLIESEGGVISDPAVRYHASETIRVGSNILTSQSAVLGTGWSGDYTNGFTHASGNIQSLTFNIATTASQLYVLEFDSSVLLSNPKCYVSIGDGILVDPYNGTYHFVIGFKSDGGYLKFTPDSGLTGTISNITLKPLDSNGTDLSLRVDNVNHGSPANNVTGFWNVAVGGDTTLRDNVSGSRNIVFGVNALTLMEHGTRNIAIGTFAMAYVHEAERNISIGADSLYGSNDSTHKKAIDNVAIGKAAMRHGTNVQNNVAIGTNAMSKSDAEAQRNIAIGTGAGNYSHNDNTHIGFDSGYYTKGAKNVSLGSKAGSDLYNTGDENVCIGYNAGTKDPASSSSNIVTINNSIAVGANVKATASNQARFGNSSQTVILAGKKINFNVDGTVTWESL